MKSVICYLNMKSSAFSFHNSFHSRCPTIKRQGVYFGEPKSMSLRLFWTSYDGCRLRLVVMVRFENFESDLHYESNLKS